MNSPPSLHRFLIAFAAAPSHTILILTVSFADSQNSYSNSNSLILLGISTHWQNVVTGLIIIAGTAATAIQNQRNAKKLAVKLTES